MSSGIRYSVLISVVFAFLAGASAQQAGAQQAGVEDPIGQEVVSANFTFLPSKPTVGEQIQFTDTSTGNPTNWQWDFENPPNGTDSTVQNPTYTFNSPGTYPVKLIASVPPLDIDEITINVTVSEAADPGEIRFSSSNYSVNENVGTASITLQRVNGSSGAVSVRCDTSNGTATAGSDYTATSDTLNWSDGDTANKTCTIPITNDSLCESDETINLSLSNFTGGAGSGSPNTATLTIMDNDSSDPGDLSYAQSNYSVNENVGTATVSIRRTGGSCGAVSVRCNTSNGTAVAGQDYTATTDTLNWSNGDTANKNCTIPINDDSTFESNETVSLSLSNFTGGAGAGSPSNAILTINDNDDPPPVGTLQFTEGGYSVNENIGTASITVSRTNGSEGTVSVQCNTSNGTAVAGQDYTATSDILTWTDGDATNKTCTIPITEDSSCETVETINLSLSNFTGGAGSGSPSTAVLNINEDDTAVGDLSYTESSYSVNEDVGTATVQLRRTGGQCGTVSVRCNTSNGTASSGSDYTTTTDTLTWTNDDTANKDCTIPINDDAIAENDETVNLSLSNFTGGAGSGSPSSAVLTIVDDDESPGQFQFPASTLTLEEDVGTSNIPVQRVAGSVGAVSVTCRSVAGGTATSGSDYNNVNTVLNWSDGDSSSKNCPLTIINDATLEGDETIILELQSPTGGATLGTPSTGTITISANDNPGKIRYTSVAFAVHETGINASVTVERIEGDDGAVSVRCDTADGTATAGSDYSATQDTLNWSDGDSANKICTIPIVNDVNDENDETINLSLSNFTGGATAGTPSTAVLTITDNDEAGDISFIAGAFPIFEDDGDANVILQRTGGSDGAVSVSCNTAGGTATGGVDYTITQETIHWSDGDNSNKTCIVPIIADNTEEPGETISMTLSNFTNGATSGAQSTSVINVFNDDEGGKLRFTDVNYSVLENVGEAQIPIERIVGTDGEVTVRCDTANGSAGAGNDYIATMDTLTWPHGDGANKLCTIPIIDDIPIEGPQTIVLSLVNETGGAVLGSTPTAILTIIDERIFADGFEDGSWCGWSSATETCQETLVADSASDPAPEVLIQKPPACRPTQLAPVVEGDDSEGPCAVLKIAPLG